MKINESGLDLLKSFEKLESKAYCTDGSDTYTIGYGHTQGVLPGEVITEVEADSLLNSQHIE